MLNEYKEALKSFGKAEIVDSAFKLFVDNQINALELNELLMLADYKLNEEFFSLPRSEQKKYYKHTIHVIPYGKGIKEASSKTIFNKNYYNDLASNAKKNKEITKYLIDYTREIDNVALSIITMQRVKLNNISYIMQYEAWQPLIKENKLQNVFDLFVAIKHKNNNEYFNKLKKYLANPLGFNLDLDNEFVKLAFMVEYILSDLKPKIANTIKIKFLVCSKDYFKASEYNDELISAKTLINKHINSFKANAIKEMFDYYKDKTELLDSFNDNGYRAIYYSIIGGVKLV